MIESTTKKSCLVALACSFAMTAQAADAQRQIEVPAGDLLSAIEVLQQQSDVQVVYSDVDLKGLTTTGVRGALTAQEAVRKLLEGTKLRLSLDQATGAMLIVKEGIKPTARVGDEGVALRLAQASDTTRMQRDNASAATTGAVSSSGETGAARIEEVIVTAQKREERLQDVPISISSLGGADLDQSTAQSVNDVLSSVPGVSVIGAGQAGGSMVTVRGVAPAAPFFGGSNTVSYYLDSVPFNLVNSAIAPDASAYDMERIEVLRGPQGTLYGASALNGVVRVLTKDADLDEFDFKARTSGSSTKAGDPSYRADLALNAPLIEGKLGARAVVGYQNLGGWIDKVSGEKDVNDGEVLNLRLKLNAQPTDALSIGLSTWAARQDFGAPPAMANREGLTRALVDEPLSIDYEVHGLKIGYDFPAVSLTSSTGYLNYEVRDTIDYGVIVFGLSNALHDRFDINVLSEELNLTSTGDGPWRWTAGAFYRRGENRTTQTLVPTVLPFTIILDWTDTSSSYAVFGELTRRFAEAWELTLGARYFHDEVRSKANPASTFVQPNYDEQETFEATTPRAVLTWFPRKDLTLYASYSEGFRSGSPQAFYVTGGVPGFPPVKPDRLHNYEIGSKADLLEGRLSVEAAVYYIDWQDVQHYITVPFEDTNVAAVVNGDTASGLGFDLGLMARPIEGLELGVSFNKNDLTVDSDVISSNQVLIAKGDRLSYSPEYTIGASASYLFPLGSTGLTGLLAASYSQLSAQSNRAIVAGAALAAEGDIVSVGRVSFSVRSPNRWEMMLFADNITNEEGEYYHSAADVAPNVEGNRVRPRTIGLQLEYQW